MALGLLTSVATPAGTRLVPNPAPPRAAWDVLEIPDEPGWGPRAHALVDFQTLATDVQHLARWAPDGVLRATPVDMAVRLATPVDDILGALRFLAVLGHHLESRYEQLDHDAAITLSLR